MENVEPMSQWNTLAVGSSTPKNISQLNNTSTSTDTESSDNQKPLQYALLGDPLSYRNFEFNCKSANSSCQKETLALVKIPYGLTVDEVISPKCQVMVLGSFEPHFNAVEDSEIVSSQTSNDGNMAVPDVQLLEGEAEFELFEASPCARSSVKPTASAYPTEKTGGEVSNDTDFISDGLSSGDTKFKSSCKIGFQPPTKKTDKWIKTKYEPIWNTKPQQNLPPYRVSSEKKRLRQSKITSFKSSKENTFVDVSSLKEYSGGARNFNELNESEAEGNMESPLFSCLKENVKWSKQSTPPDLDATIDVATFEANMEPPRNTFKPFDGTKTMQHGKTQVDMDDTISILKELHNSPSKLQVRDSVRRQPKPQNFDDTMEILKDFDRVPEKSLDLQYGQAVRKKTDKAALAGLVCDQCENYFKTFENQLHPSEIQRVLDQCSRHRCPSKKVGTVTGMKDDKIHFEKQQLVCTPPGYWDNTIPSTQEAIRSGLIKIGVPSPGPKKRLYIDDSEGDA